MTTAKTAITQKKKEKFMTKMADNYKLQIIIYVIESSDFFLVCYLNDLNDNKFEILFFCCCLIFLINNLSKNKWKKLKLFSCLLFNLKSLI